MLKLKINLFVAEDGYQKVYPVTIFDGNIKPDIPNDLPHCKDERVNFQFQYAPTYADISNGKVNTRFLYPYSRTYKKADIEGSYAAYAHLNIFQRIKLGFINKSTFYHKNKVASITLLVNILLGIANIIFAVINLNLRGDYSYQKTTTEQTKLLIQQSELLQKQAEATRILIERQNQIDTLQQKEKLK